MNIRQRINHRLREINSSSLESWVTLWRGGFLLPRQKVFFQSVKADSFDEGQAASLPKQVLQIRGAMGFDVQAGDTFEYDGQQWQVTDEPLAVNSSVATRVIARRIQ